jgi:glutamine synthetase
MGTKSKLEYIWLDGYRPTQSLRSKTKVVEDFSGELADVPQWCFDGSSTEQAEGGDSDCLLKHVALYPDPARKNDERGALPGRLAARLERSRDDRR